MTTRSMTRAKAAEEARLRFNILSPRPNLNPRKRTRKMKVKWKPLQFVAVSSLPPPIPRPPDVYRDLPLEESTEPVSNPHETA